MAYSVYHGMIGKLGEAKCEVERVWVYTHAWPSRNWQQLDVRLPVLPTLSC